MLTIAKISFKEILYKRIFLIALVMTLAYIVFYGIATHFAASEYLEDMGHMGNVDLGEQLIRQYMISSQLLGAGLYFSNFIVGLLAVLASVGSIAGSIENHQIDPVLTRPLRRSDIVLGKFLGLGALLVLYALFLFTSIILINQLLGGPFRVELAIGQIIKASFLFACIPLTVISPALFLSSCLSTINGGIILIILYGMSFVGGFVEQIGNMIKNTSLVNIGIISSLVFPLDSLFRKTNFLLFESPDDPLSMAATGLFWGSSQPSNLMLIYSGIYTLLILLLAVRQFSVRDI